MTTLPVSNSTVCMCGQLYGSWNSGYISSHFLFVSPCFLLSLKVGTYFLTPFDFLWGWAILDSWFQISHPCLDCCTVPSSSTWHELICAVICLRLCLLPLAVIATTSSPQSWAYQRGSVIFWFLLLISFYIVIYCFYMCHNLQPWGVCGVSLLDLLNCQWFLPIRWFISLCLILFSKLLTKSVLLVVTFLTN